MNNILITGSSGFLGSCLKNKLSINHNVFDLNSKSGDFIYSLEKEIPNFNQISFDCVIHSAGKAHFTPKNKKDKNGIYNNNVNGTKNLLIGLEKSFFPKYFVFISSISVYGLVTGENINESNPLNATDDYGISKISCEIMILDWCKVNNVKCTILRLPLVVGENPPGNLSAMINGIKRGYYFNIDNGIANKSMVLRSDVAKYILKAAIIGGVYNLTDGIHPTFKQLSYEISKVFGKTKTPNLKITHAILLAKMGDIIGDIFPFNTSILHKITSPLTFDDMKARYAFDWQPESVLIYFKNKKITDI